MKKIRFTIVILVLVLIGALMTACTDKPQNDSEGGYTVTILNHSKWTTSGNVEFYDLTGKLVGDAPIESGKATAELSDGTYIVQLAEAPESVNYGIVVLDSENKMQTIELTDSKAGDKMMMFEVLVVVMRGNNPLPGYEVTLCFEPEDGEGGYCLLPDFTDANGLFSSTANAGRFHVSIASPDGTGTVYDGISELTASHRFIIVEVGE